MQKKTLRSLKPFGTMFFGLKIFVENNDGNGSGGKSSHQAVEG